MVCEDIGQFAFRTNRLGKSPLLAATWVVAVVPVALAGSSVALGHDAPTGGQRATAANAETPVVENSLPFVFLNPWGEDAGAVGEIFRKETLPNIDVSGLLVIRSLCAEIRPNDVIVGIDKVKITNKGNAKRGVEKTTRMAGPVDLTLFRLDGLEWRQQVVRCPLITRSEFLVRLEADEKRLVAAREAAENRTFVDKAGRAWTTAEIERHNDPLRATLERVKQKVKDDSLDEPTDRLSTWQKLTLGDGVLGGVIGCAKRGEHVRHSVTWQTVNRADTASGGSITIYTGLSAYMNDHGKKRADCVEQVFELTSMEEFLVPCADGRVRPLVEVWNMAILNKGYSPIE